MFRMSQSVEPLQEVFLDLGEIFSDKGSIIWEEYGKIAVRLYRNVC